MGTTIYKLFRQSNGLYTGFGFRLEHIGDGTKWGRLWKLTGNGYNETAPTKTELMNKVKKWIRRNYAHYSTHPAKLEQLLKNAGQL